MRPTTVRRSALALAVSIVFAAASCAASVAPPRAHPQDQATPRTLLVEPIALAGSLAPSATPLPGGGFIVSAMSREGNKAELHVQTVSPEGRAEPPRPVADGEDWFVNWADFPSVAVAANGDWVTFYLRKSDPARPYAYDIFALRSTDRGITWSTPVKLHDDDTQTEHGFVSLVPAPAPADTDPDADAESDAVVAVWLDGRRNAHAGGGHDHDHGGSVTTLRSTTLRRDAIEPSVELDDLTCDCCTTDAVRAGGSVFAVYRDRSPEEIRDIGFVRTDGAGWSRPGRVADDAWKIAGCPVNGPALAESESGPLAAWPTMQGDELIVRTARYVAGEWAPPQDIDRGTGVLGRVDLAPWLGDQVLISWLGQSDGQAATLWLGILDGSGKLVSRQPVTELPPGRSTGMPRLASSGDEALLVWTESSSEGTRVVGALIRPGTN